MLKRNFFGNIFPGNYLFKSKPFRLKFTQITSQDILFSGQKLREFEGKVRFCYFE